MMTNYPELVDGFTQILSRVNPKSTPEGLGERVIQKVNQLTGQEPFFLKEVLASNQMSDYEKAGAFIFVRNTLTGEPRYPKNYHIELMNETDRMRS